MQHLIDSVRKSIADKNWYAALTMALALPDIASALDCGGLASGKKYITWFDEYLRQEFGHSHSEDPDATFLSGRDCYALRCAFLHQAGFETTEKQRELVHKFKFVMHSNSTWHNNLYDFGEPVLELEVDLFCEQICFGVGEWLNKRGGIPEVSERIANLSLINFS